MNVAGIVAERLANQRGQESLPRSDVGQAGSRRSCGQLFRRRIGPVILRLQTQQFLLGNRFDAHPPSVENFQFSDGIGIIPLRNPVTAHLRTLAAERHKPVFGGFGGGQQLDDLGRNRADQFHSPAVLKTTYTESVSAMNPASGMVAGRLTAHHPSATRVAASRKRT